MQNIDNDKFIPDFRRFVTKEKFEEIKRSAVTNGDVIISKTGSLGYVAIIPERFERAVITSRLAKLSIDWNQIEKKYFFHYLIYLRDKGYWQKIAKGTTMKILNIGQLAETEVPLPLMPEQKAIVLKIEELLSDIENGKQQLYIAQQQLKVYRQSLLKTAFEGKLTNKDVKGGELPKGWNVVSITDLADKNKHSLKAGPFGSSLKKDFYVKEGYKIYGQEQVIRDDPFFGDYYINEEKYQELISCKIRPFDVLISLVGTVGKVLILPENCKSGIINPRLIKISLNTELYLPKFFKYYFESSFVKSLYGNKAQGTTMDVLNLGIIKTIPFLLPPLIEQQLIVDELESKLTICNKIEETLFLSLQQAETLRQSILKKAFEGRLVTSTEKVPV
jgi:type I restriction enzyme S subunit